MTVQQTAFIDVIDYLQRTPRPPASQEEYEAAVYVHEQLKTAGVDTPEEMPFYTLQSLGERLAVGSLLAGLGLGLGLRKSRLAKRAGVFLSLMGSMNLRRSLRGQPVWGEVLFPQRRSQNIMGRILPQGEILARVIFLVNLDTRDRIQVKNTTLQQLRPYLFDGLLLTAFTGTTEKPFRLPGVLRRLLSLALFGSAGLLAARLSTGETEIVDNNAIGIALLLNLAQGWTQQPLQNTEIILAFTGSETVGGRGGAELVGRFEKEWGSAYWVVIKEMGFGELGWISEHGLSRSTRYTPHPDAEALIRRVAVENRALGLSGHSSRTLDAVSFLVEKRLKAIAIGSVPHHEQASAGTIALHPERWERSRTFLRALVNKVDAEANS